MLAGVVDVHYPPSGGARAALVLADDPKIGHIVDERVVELPEVADYEPGKFYLRELPCVRAVLAGVEGLTLLAVDGYVDLAPDGQHRGLGAHVFDEFGIPVIGIAKTRFHSATHAAEVIRGHATKPLYVTARGLSMSDAARLVATMTGPYRLPNAIRRVDALCRRRQPDQR